MFEGRSTKILFVLCGIAWVVIVARAYLNVKGPEDFVYTVPQSEVQAFAREQLDALQSRSFAENTEFCAIIFEDSDGELGTTPIREGAEASCDIAFFDKPGMGPVASFHTHGGYSREYDSEVPSDVDINSDIESRTDGYVATPGGRFWHISWEDRRANLVCGEGCLMQDPNYRPCPGDPIARQYSVDEINARARKPLITC